MMLEQWIEYFSGLSWMPEAGAKPAAEFVVFCEIAAVALLVYILLHRTLLRLIVHVAKKTENKWDDVLLEAGVFRRIVRLIPLVLLYIGIDRLLVKYGSGVLASRLTFAMLILLMARIAHAVFVSMRKIFRKTQLAGYLQAATVVLYVFTTIFMAASILGQSPWGLFSVLGGLTAVILLVFKDTILGFVAGVQLSANNMVEVGDWIEMPKYGADGDVIEVTLNTVKVQNWDKTISTIPPYALITDSFKNWRGMSESGGRRIKRSVNLDMNSIHFVDEAMVQRFRQIDCLSDYLEKKQQEIDAENKQRGVNLSVKVNGRRQTNVGIFRAYLQQYLRNHPMVHDKMTFLVRQLQPTAEGLPIEIYVFSRDQVWANYEAIQADIFDHVLAALPEFELRVFQSPTGSDFRAIQGI
jgi:miniconductance mechanosensitive channel